MKKKVRFFQSVNFKIALTIILILVISIQIIGAYFIRGLELCCFEWFQNLCNFWQTKPIVLELCCFEWFQNNKSVRCQIVLVLELCCFEWFQN